MDKLSQIVVAIMVIMLAIMLTACTETVPETNPPPENQPAEPPPDHPIKESADYHIGMVTLGIYSDDEVRAVEALIAKYGTVKDGGMIKHVVLPDIIEEQELYLWDIIELGHDPLMKAIIVNPAVQGTADAFYRIKAAGRDDILLIAVMPQDDPVVISQVASIIVDSDNVLRGYYDIARAKEMGATTFVHMSFPRHMNYYVLARRRAIYEEACKDLGLKFVFETLPDPAGDIDPAGARQQVYDLMPELIEKYGKDTVFFTTNTALFEPVIKRVVELGALFVDTDDMSPLCGFPAALGIDLSAESGDWPAIVKKIEAAVVAKGASGRLGLWPFSFTYTAGVGLCELAKDIIEGTDSGNALADIVKNFHNTTPGCDWVSGNFTYPDGNKIDNYYCLTMDTYILGKGYSGVMREPFPEKYYRIE